MMAPFAGRHLTLQELHAGMGYPSVRRLALAAQVDTYTVYWPGTNISYSAMKQALGNSMHVAQIGVWMTIHLACRSLKTVEDEDSIGSETI